MVAQDEKLVVLDSASLAQRLFVLFAATCWFFAAKEANSALEPAVSSLIAGAPKSYQPVLEHALMYSATTGLLCAVGWLLLWRMKRLTAPVLRFDLDVLVVGCIVGIGVSIVTSIVWIAMGHSIGFSFSAAKALGDAFSNMYEEISYRGLLFGAALYSMRRPALAMLFSGAVFAYTHQQYPLAFQVLIVFVGAAFAFGYMRTGSLWAAWVAHQFSDVVLDTILQS